MPTCKRMKLDSYFTQNFKSKLIRDINLRAKIKNSRRKHTIGFL